jgi:hypothetical protein
MRTILPLIIILLTIFATAGCRQDNISPIRNVRFDPKLLNPLKAAGACNSYGYYTGAKLRNLGTIQTRQLVVSFDDKLTNAQREQVITKYGFVTGIESQRAGQSGMIYTLGLMQGLNCAQTEQAILELKKDNAIKYVGPYFNLDGVQDVGLSNEVMVKADATGEVSLKQFAANYKAKLIGPLGADTYLLQVDKASKGNALDAANALKGQKGILHATPDFILAN